MPVIALLKQSASAWMDDKCPRMGAALAFYSALSLGPLVVIVLAVGGMFWSKDILTKHLVDKIADMIGSDSAGVITSVIAHSQQPSEGLVASIIGMMVLLVGASGVFGELQDALNTIWHVPPKKSQPFYTVITGRFLSFAMVLGTGFLLMISLTISTVLGIVTDYADAQISLMPYVMKGLNILLSFAITTCLFGLIFKYIPDRKIEWRDIGPGALATALLFDIGKYFIGLYLGHGAIGSTYGAAGSVVVFLVWIYYSAQILYFGAEITKCRSQGAGRD